MIIFQCCDCAVASPVLASLFSSQLFPLIIIQSLLQFPSFTVSLSLSLCLYPSVSLSLSLCLSVSVSQGLHWSVFCTDRDCKSREDEKYRDAVWELFQEETKYLTRQLQPLEQVLPILPSAIVTSFVVFTGL